MSRPKWFDELYPKVPREFPPDLNLRKGKTYRVIFKEKEPRVVIGGYKRATAVINVEYDGELRSLYVGSNVDLARHIANLNEDKKDLRNITVDIIKVEKRGKNWIYEVKSVSD